METKTAMKMLTLQLQTGNFMSTGEIKTELRQMIENETDMNILLAIRTILVKTGLNPVLKEKLTMRALKSEDDIKAGRVFTKEEVIRKTSR